MLMSDTMEQRKTSLLEELTHYERRGLNFAWLNYWSAQISLGLSLAAAGLAALLGIIPALSAHFEKWELSVASALSVGFTTLSWLVLMFVNDAQYPVTARIEQMQDLEKQGYVVMQSGRWVLKAT